MKVLITGTPGSGKTSMVIYAHQQKDKRFFDTDEIIGLCEWREFETGKVLGLVTEHEAVSGDSWYKKYGWYWKTDFLVKFLQDHPDAVLCGSAENNAECYKYFDKIFILKKTEKELLSNLQSPDRTNPFGKTPEQRKNFLNWQNYLINEAKKYNPIILKGNDIKETYKKVYRSVNLP